MAQIDAVNLLLAPNAARTATGNTNEIIIPSRFTACIMRADFAAGTGTSPTLNLFVQRGIKDIGNATAVGEITDGSYVWNDFVAFLQVTGSTSEQWTEIVGGGNLVPTAVSDGALAAGSVRNGPIGGVWRVKWVIAGTNPSFAFDVVAQLIP
jgi:hypothetical protein